MRKPIHYHVYPKTEDWYYEYNSDNKQGGKTNNGNVNTQYDNGSAQNDNTQYEHIDTDCQCEETLKQYGDRISELESLIRSLYKSLNTQISSHEENEDVHVSEEDRERWNNNNPEYTPSKIDIDSDLDSQSPNPVRNSTITNALQQYITLQQLRQAIAGFANRSELKPVAFTGRYQDLSEIPEITCDCSKIVNMYIADKMGYIQYTLDGTPISATVTDNVLSIQYEEEDTKLSINSLGNTLCFEQHRDGEPWIIPDTNVDLSSYITETDSDLKYLIPEDKYLTPTQAEELYQPKQDSNSVVITTSQYRALVASNNVNSNTYYFTYDGEEETETWGFGDQFPIILTEGTTSDSIGEFPINLA